MWKVYVFAKILFLYSQNIGAAFQFFRLNIVSLDDNVETKNFNFIGIW